ncbi:MAG: putative adhesin [Janthinobacterium lividum]
MATVDALGYLTARSYDAFGELLASTEFAQAADDTAGAIPQAPLSVNDRVARFRWDAMGRLLEESHGSSDRRDGFINDGNPGALGEAGAIRGASPAITRYAYDALGNRTMVIDATGAATTTSYDALGRIASVRMPARTVVSAGTFVDGQLPGSTEVLASPLTVMLRDALGNLSARLDYSNSTGNGIADGADFFGNHIAPGTQHDSVRIERTLYDGLGQVIAQTDAAGNTSWMSYDHAGRLAKQWQTVADLDGRVRTVFQVQRFDALGRVVSSLTPAPDALDGSAGAGASVVETVSRYNAFGELVAHGSTGAPEEYADYDQAGRLWRTNGGDGVDRILLYDIAGRTTAELRSDGGTNLRQFTDAQQAAQSAGMRRTERHYDALGRLVAEVGAQRVQVQGGVKAWQVGGSSEVIGSAALVLTPVASEQGSLEPLANWSGSNRVRLNWSSLASLGSGDVKLEMTYLTRGYAVQADDQGNGAGTAGTTFVHPGELRTRSGIFPAVRSDAGVVLEWQDAPEPAYRSGGVERVTRLQVWKKDLHGLWQSVLDTGAEGNAGGLRHGANVIDVAAPTDPASSIVLQVRVADVPGAAPHNTAESGWLALPLLDFGDSLRGDLDAAAVAAGVGIDRLEYRVMVRAPGQSSRVSASGSLTLQAPVLESLGTPWMLGGAGNEALLWTTPGGGIEQVLRVRTENGGWSSVAITQAAGQSSLDLRQLAAGRHELELLWIHAGQARPYAHASATLTIAPASPGHEEQRVVQVEVPYTVVPPDPAAFIIGWSVEPLYSRPVMLGYDESSGFLFGLGYGYASITLPDGSVIHGPVVAIPYRDGNGTLVVPPDPAQFLISPGGGRPVYGYPVIVGLGENGEPVAGRGYEFNIEGVAVAVPYVEQRLEQHTMTVWVETPQAPRTLGLQTTSGAGVASSVAGQLAQAGISAYSDGTSWHLRPVAQRRLDRWGNVLELRQGAAEMQGQADGILNLATSWASSGAGGLASVTTAAYDAQDRMIWQRAADGGITSWQHDQMGRLVATTDANGHVNAQRFDSAGQLIEERHADGGVIRHGYDSAGNRVLSIDALGQRSMSWYDQRGLLLHTASEAVARHDSDAATRLVDLGSQSLASSWTYDQLGRRLTQRDGNGAIIGYRYDRAGNLVASTSALGAVTRHAYDGRGHLAFEVDANGLASSWQSDYFGHQLGHVDLGGATYAYAYDQAGQLNSQTSSRGANQRFEYDGAGQLVAIRDLALDQQSYFSWDAGGRRVREKIVQAGQTVQDNHITRDAMGRLRTVEDGQTSIVFDYDAMGNRKRIRSHLIDASGQPQDADRWFAYDAMNRQILVDGVNDNPADDANLREGQGHRLAYDLNGNRISDASWGRIVVQGGGEVSRILAGYDSGQLDESGQRVLLAEPHYDYDEGGNAILLTPPVYRDIVTPVSFNAVPAISTEHYTYDARNRLSSVKRDGLLVDQRYYDGADRLLQSGPAGGLPRAYVEAYASTLDSAAQAIASGMSLRNWRYDADGHLRHERASWSDGAPKSDIDYGNIDALGNVLGYTVATHGQDAGATGTGGTSVTAYSVTQQHFDGYRDAVVLASRVGAGAEAPARVESRHDVNGNLAAVFDSADSGNDRRFVSDSSGRIVYSNQGGRIVRQIIADGAVLAQVGGALQPGASAAQAQAPAPVNGVDSGFRSIGAATHASGAGYRAATGDTLRSVAQAVYGDSRLWYLIARQNGLSADVPLSAGQWLMLPSRIAGERNDATTFRPYDAATVVGNTIPFLPDLGTGSAGGGGCGGVGRILTMVVAIAVTVYSAGILAAPAAGTAVIGGATASAGSLAGGFGLGSLGTSMVAGGLGSLAGQGLGIAIGAQERLDWRAVAMGAIGAGVSNGVARLFGGPLAGSLDSTAGALQMTGGLGGGDLGAGLINGSGGWAGGFSGSFADGTYGSLTQAGAGLLVQAGSTTAELGAAIFGTGTQGAIGMLKQAGTYAARAALGSALTQGLGLLSGANARFDWRAVASAAASAGAASLAEDLFGKSSASGDGAAGKEGGASGDGSDGGLWTYATAQALGRFGNRFGALYARQALSGAASAMTVQMLRGGRLALAQVATDAFGIAIAQSIVEQADGAHTQVAPQQTAAQRWSAVPDLHATEVGMPDVLAGTGYTEEAWWNSTPPSLASRYVSQFGGVLQEVSADAAEQFLPPVEVISPRDEEAGEISAIGAVDRFFTFNPMGRTLKGAGLGSVAVLGSMFAGLQQSVLAAGDLVSAGLSALDRAAGGTLAYDPVSELGQSLASQGLANTGLEVAGGFLRNTVGALTAPLNAAYLHDAQRLGESLPAALLAATSLTPLNAFHGAGTTMGSASLAVLEQGAVRALPGPTGHFLAESITPGGSGTALSGHGGRFRGDTTFVVPQGTSITLPRPNISILDTTGVYIESGQWDKLAAAARRDPRIADDILGMTTWLPGARVPAYTLFEPDSGINLLGNSHSVIWPTPLRQLLEPNLGNVQWAACTSFLPYDKWGR